VCFGRMRTTIGTYVRTYVPWHHWYVCHVPWYQLLRTMVPMVHLYTVYHGPREYLPTNGIRVRTMVPWYGSTSLVPWYVHVYVQGTMVQPGRPPVNPQTRTTTETVLREAMQALVRVQAHMLARIVVEIRAAP
jgi:hypothetical protein